MNRRNFLASLGLAAAGVAFKPITGHAWLAPRDLVQWDGPVTPEWIAAEALRLLAENCELETMTLQPGMTRLAAPGSARQFGITLMADEMEMRYGQKQYSECYIEPAMARMGAEIREMKPRFSGVLEIPVSVDHSYGITNEGKNFNLRYIRAFDIGGAGEYTDEETGETTHWSTPPGFISRFDMLVAA